MRPEFLKRLLLVLPVVLLAACGGGGMASTPASTPVASTHSDPTTPPPSGRPAADTAALRDVVCKALSEIVTDMKAVPYKPEAVLAQFTLKVSGYATSAANISSLVADADTVAQAGCPAERSAVLKAAGQSALADLLK